MGKKSLGSRSGNTKRQMTMAFELVKGGMSYQKAIDSVPNLTIGKSGLQKAFKKWEGTNATAAPPSTISWGQNLAHVSAVVDNERKTVPKPRSCKAIIAAESAFPKLCSATVNTHIRKNLAGKLPRDFKRPTFISKEDHLRICAALARASDDLEPFTCAETQGILQEMIDGTDFSDLFKDGTVSRQFAYAFRTRMSKKNGGVMSTEYPQNMTPLRAEWTTFANLQDYFDICRKSLLETANEVAVLNPEYEAATEEERKDGRVDRCLIRIPGAMGTLDEMPLTLNVPTGQQPRSDKKFGGCVQDIADLTLTEGMMTEWAVALRESEGELNKAKGNNGNKSKLRGDGRMRQRTTKFNKVGTLVMGSKGNGDPYIPLVIIRSAKLAKEHTFSMVEGPDGLPLKVDLPKLRIAGKNRDAFVAATPNGGMNPDLFAEYLEKCVFPCHPLMSPTEQCVFFWDGDESHMMAGTRLSELKNRGAVIIPPKPNTTTDCQGPDLVNFPVVQQRVRAECSHRQRLIRRMDGQKRRPLDYRDVVAIIGPAIQRGFSRSNNLAAWEESGLVPFSEKPLYADHIQATKGKVVKKNTLNYDVLQWDKPLHPQMMEQIGRGNRLTTGKICGRPMTDEMNVRLFEELEKEKRVATEGKAATARKKAKAPLPGDDALILRWEEQKVEEARVKLEHAQERQRKGIATAADLKLFKSRVVKKIQQQNAPPTPAPSAPKTNRKRKRKTKRQEDSASEPSDGDSSSDDEDIDKGKDLLYKLFEDEGQLFKVVGFGVSEDNDRLLFYQLDGKGAEEEYSSVAEVREWVQAYEARN